MWKGCATVVLLSALNFIIPFSLILGQYSWDLLRRRILWKFNGGIRPLLRIFCTTVIILDLINFPTFPIHFLLKNWTTVYVRNKPFIISHTLGLIDQLYIISKPWKNSYNFHLCRGHSSFRFSVRCAALFYHCNHFCFNLFFLLFRYIYFQKLYYNVCKGKTIYNFP